MEEPIAVEESVDEGSLPESRNFICGVVEGPMENPDNPALFSPNREANMSQDKVSTIPSLLNVSDNPWQCGTRYRKADETQTRADVDVNLLSNKRCTETQILLNKIQNSKRTNFENCSSNTLEKTKKEIKQERNISLMEKSTNVPASAVDLPNTCANPWKCKKARTDISGEDISINEQTISEALLLLNKLDRESFYPISKQFYSLHFNENNMYTIIDVLFKKASAESIYVEEYADIIQKIHGMIIGKENVCKHESNLEYFVNKPELKNNFTASLKKCVEYVIDNPTTNLMFKLKGADITEAKREYRDQVTNVLIFIAALFKRNLIETKQVLNLCLNLMTEERNELILQSLAVFLIKCGEKIESSMVNSLVIYQLQWNQVVEYVRKAICSESILCKKTNFMLQDFIELKHNEWIPRMIENSELQLSSFELLKREKKRFKHIKNKKDLSLYYSKELQFLNVTKQPWRRGCFKCKQILRGTDVFTRLKMILNGINEDNFDLFYKKFMQICIFKSETVVVSCVEIVLNKFIEDSKYNKIYLRLLKLFATHMKTRDHKPEKSTSDVDASVFFNLLAKKSIEKLTATHLRSHERETLSNSCFLISELFNSNLMDPTVLFSLLSTLLCKCEDQKLFCLTRLVLFCRENIEKHASLNDDHQFKWANILEKTQNICDSKSGGLSERTLLMLSSILNLKKSKWMDKSKQDLSVITESKQNTSRDACHIQKQQDWKEEKHVQTAAMRLQKENVFQTREQFLVKDVLKDLDTVDNPWRRGEFKQELTKSEQTIMNAKTLLNKLAENNFNSIVEQFAKLNFSPDTVAPILNILFVKAILETKFMELHAKFVKTAGDLMGTRNERFRDSKLGQAGNENQIGTEDNVGFDLKTLIVDKCVTEIDYINADSNLITDEIYHQKQRLSSDNEIGPPIQTGLCLKRKNVTVKRQKQEIFLPDHYRQLLKKKISVGTCHFLGELFNADVVDVKFIITTLLCDLLPYDTEESVECAIKLISVVGKKLERTISRAADEDCQVGWNFVLENIATKAAPENREWSNRIYFMLLDVIDLRERDWLPRIIIVPTRQFRVPKKPRGF